MPSTRVNHFASGRDGIVATVDPLASEAGAAVLRRGGTAVDAAIAANAVLSVTAPHLCGLGGDLFALVSKPGEAPIALNASGRSGSGADPDALRANGHRTMPLSELAAVTVPGCVDGWIALHRRGGTLPLAELFGDAIRHATDGFTPSPLLVLGAARVTGRPGTSDLDDAAAGRPVRRPGIAATLRAIGENGRAGLYRGAFGAGLLGLGGGLFRESDLDEINADWVEPVRRDAFGHTVWTTPANTQGYVAALALGIADRIGVSDLDGAEWAHTLIEASRLAGVDRPKLLHEGADVAALLTDAEVDKRAARFDPNGRADLTDTVAPGGTTYLCVVDGSGTGVSLIQSNAAGFGSGIFEPATGIGLHNRGLGFSLEPGHPAEFGPRRRPPHTLMPMIVTRPDGTLRTVAGTMGGDTQPQIMTQLLTRLLHNDQSATEVVSAPRWRIGNTNGFDTWSDQAAPVELESDAPYGWDDLAARGHRVTRVPVPFGHAQLIDVDADGTAHGAADPRAVVATTIAV
ncbi:gamma-glutamyltransferase family protein [Stackebrandtia soli]|uniref:gamma-glutamyltransferase family protein n=1 Tax=Stackebrandtia soli TaxID=1892856 RepID=UPI0039EA1733